MKIVLNLQFLTCKKYSEHRSTVKNCNFSKLQFFKCTSTVIPLHIFAVLLTSFKIRSNHSFLVFTSEGLLKALQKAVIAWANRFGERDVNNSIGRVIPKVHWASNRI